MMHLTRQGQVFMLTMDAGKKHLNTTFVGEFDKRLDEVEAAAAHLLGHAQQFH